MAILRLAPMFLSMYQNSIRPSMMPATLLAWSALWIRKVVSSMTDKSQVL